MNRSVEALVEQVGEYVRRFDRVSAGGRFDGLSSAGPARLLTDEELLAVAAVSARLVRLAQAEQVALAGEIARRCEPRDDTSLARKMGAASAANLVAQVTGVLRAQAGTMVASGEAFRPRENPFTGEPMPAVCPQIAAAFAAGLLDPEVAAGMRRALAKAAPGLAPFEVDVLEGKLVDVAQEGWGADDLLGWLKQVPTHAHPDGGAPNPDAPAPSQSVTRKALKNGLFRWVLDLDTLTDGFLKTAVDANTAIKRSLLSTPDEPEPDAETADRRPLAQRRVDGIRLLAKKALKVDDGQVGGTAVTLLVTMTEEALKSGLGVAQLPDCGSEIPASIARMLAADAEIIPVVLGGKSQPLDLGQGRRYFSMAQRRAMVIRDGGCVGPGCDAPPSWCDGAHIRPAGYGPTDLANGVLLCWRCHLLLDQQGWQLDRIDGTGRKRPGGRIPPIDLAG
jgi:hypothetical protein